MNKSRLRVVSGSCRGLRLTTPEGQSVRPTSERAREGVFNSLGSLDWIDGAEVLDLFAGSGAMGIEALSRGAQRATFVDSSRDAIDAVKENLETTGLAESARVVRSRADDFLDNQPDMFDLAILDPPYQFTDWPTLLDQVNSRRVVIESKKEVELIPRWSKVRVRNYGATVVVIAEANGS